MKNEILTFALIFMAVIVGIAIGHDIWGKKADVNSIPIEKQTINNALFVKDAIYVEPWKNLGPYQWVQGGYIFTHTDAWRVTQIREVETGRIVPGEKWAEVVKETFK